MGRTIPLAGTFLIVAALLLASPALAYTSSWKYQSQSEDGEVMTFSWTFAGSSASEVKVEVELRGDFDATSETADIRIDGVELGTHDGSSDQCGTTYASKLFDAPGYVVGDGSVTVDVDLSSSVTVGTCPADVRVRFVYTAGSVPACGDGIDNDGDGQADYPNDGGCDSYQDTAETGSGYICDDGLDNDGDGYTDYPADPGCASATSNIEDPDCDDGADNDGDGYVDHPDDPGCSSRSDNDERETVPVVERGPYSQVTPGCNGVDTVCYRLGAVLLYQGRRYGQVVEGSFDSNALPATVPNVPNGVYTMGPDADGDGIQATLTLHTTTHVFNKDGSYTTTSGAPQTYQVDPDDTDGGNPAAPPATSATVRMGCQQDAACASAATHMRVLGQDAGDSVNQQVDLGPSFDTGEALLGARPVRIDSDRVVVNRSTSANASTPTVVVAPHQLWSVRLGGSTVEYDEANGVSVATPTIEMGGHLVVRVNGTRASEAEPLPSLRGALLQLAPQEQAIEAGPWGLP